LTAPQQVLIDVDHAVALGTPSKVRQLLADELPYTVAEFPPGSPPRNRRLAGGKILLRLQEGALFVPGTAQNEVRLTRFFHHLRVEPPCLDVLGVLETGVHLLDIRPGQSSVLRAAPIALCGVEDNFGTIASLFFAGLEPAVRRLLECDDRKVKTVRITECNNRTVGVVDPPPNHLPPPVAQTLDATYILDQPLIDCVRRYELAVIRYNPTTVDPASLVAQVARAWPEKTILILAARRVDVCRFRRRLRRYKIHADAVTGRNNPAEVGRIAVSTFMAMSHAPVRHEWRDIVFVLDAVEAVGKTARWCLSHARRARWYGLVPDGAKPSPFEDDLLTELFGFQEIYIPRHYHYEAPVAVVRCSIEGGPSLPPGLDDVEVKRQGIWRNPMRNRRIARLARLLHDDGADQLRRQFPAVAEALAGTSTASVFVVVENLEHGLELARKLSGWPLIAGPSPNTAGLSANDVQILLAGEEAREQRPPFAIVTAAGLQTMIKPAPGVVVRADGGVGLPVLGSIDLLMPTWHAGRRMVLVDFNDRHHPALRRWSRRRQEAYERQGWFAPGVDSMMARVDRFLAARPRGRFT
jgi:hypothetical protein